MKSLVTIVGSVWREPQLNRRSQHLGYRKSLPLVVEWGSSPEESEGVAVTGSEITAFLGEERRRFTRELDESPLTSRSGGDAALWLLNDQLPGHAFQANDAAMSH